MADADNRAFLPLIIADMQIVVSVMFARNTLTIPTEMGLPSYNFRSTVMAHDSDLAVDLHAPTVRNNGSSEAALGQRRSPLASMNV